MTEKHEAPSEKVQSTVTPSAYNALVAAARLRDIRLIKSTFSLDAEGADITPEWKLVHNCEIDNAHYNADRQALYVSVAASAICKKKSKHVLTTKCHYLIVYDVHGSPEEAIVNAFAKRVARFAAYPYFRSHFAELTMQAGVYLPPLPVIKETRLLQPLPVEGRKEIEAKKPEEE